MELKPVDKLIEFNMDGITIGSAFVTVSNGKLNTSNLEDEFYSMLRKNTKSIIAEVEADQKIEIVDRLTSAQEEILKAKHAEDYHGTDDDMPDAYESWLEDLSVAELAQIL